MMRFEQILRRLSEDYPELEFRVGERFKYRPPRTVYYEQICEEAHGGGEGEKKLEQICNETYVESSDGLKGLCRANTRLEQNQCVLQLLHEVGHALAGHRDYVADVGRLKMEREAWEQARELCGKYNVEYDEQFVENTLDTYRDWLDRKSMCKKCGLTRYQDARGRYRCPGCESL